MTVKEYIDNAIRDGKTITIKYQKYNGELSERTISNLRYSDEFGSGYICGFCHLRGEDRTFKISRIHEVDGISSYTGPTTLGKTSYSTKTAYSAKKPYSASHSSSVSTSSTSSASTVSQRQNTYSSSSTQSSSQHHSEGCYIATMAYGDYDHPQVLVLRQFRDEKVMKTSFGRLFVKFYYATSPKLVSLLKGHTTINNIIRNILDDFVDKIKKDL